MSGIIIGYKTPYYFYMCTPEQVREVLEHELFTPRAGEELGRLDKHLNASLNKLFWQIFWRLALPVIGAIAALTVGWFNLQSQVDKNSSELFVGGRYTQEEHDLYALEIDRRFTESEKARNTLQTVLTDRLDDINDDVKEIRKAVVGY